MNRERPVTKVFKLQERVFLNQCALRDKVTGTAPSIKLKEKMAILKIFLSLLYSQRNARAHVYFRKINFGSVVWNFL